ncbi:TetR family transcriptional regulator [Streptomyces sp. ISL-11]|uniref:TetR/AcrR family transcriptional regulator n=1 Tax=Streptomyces sp. ISL-11 TaxID=2819174 RepID=UPI001BE89EA7|nr:TetR family transcriptional regulator [Streptomyces sp. ISL-11]MBT2382532.1 TetR family transcriptional regulator [Streptomyces sp. ISL-11]
MSDPIPPAPQPRRPGRPAGSRTGQSPARDRILEAARRQFAQGTYASTTVRAIAAEAGVNPALVIHHFGSKRNLFAATLRLPLHVRDKIAALVRTDSADLGEHLVRLFLGLWQDPVFRAPLAAMIRSVFSDSEASDALGDFFTAEMIGPIVAASGHDQPHLRVSLVASHLLGLASARHILGIAPLVRADTEHLVACVGPVVQHYLTGDLPRR